MILLFNAFQSEWHRGRTLQLVETMASSLALASRKYLARVCSVHSFRRNICTTSPCYYYIEGAHEPFAPIPDRFPRWATSGEDAFSHLKDGAKVFVHGGAATPSLLVKELHQYVMSRGIKDVQLLHIHTEGPFPFNDPECVGHFRTNSLFTGSNCRQAINEGRADFTPIFLSEIPLLFRRKHVELDLAIVSITPPDRHGFCSLGPSVDVTRSAIQNAKFIVGQVNPHMPLTRGDASIHVSNIGVLMHGPQPLHETKARKITDVEQQIGKYIAEELVPDGATMQMGIGSIPDAVLSQLTNHQHLGVHTEMFSDRLVDLVKLGVITNSMKKMRPGKIVTSFVIGTKKCFDFLDNNPFVDMCDIAWVNSPVIIAQNPRPMAINSCIEVDLTGQVVSDSIGSRIYSGVGGQVDFIRGAAISTDGEGKPIIALPSVTAKGESKFVPYLKEGGGIVTTRAHVHYIVTEYGIAYLFGRNLRQRAHALIKIAHPDHRESLEKAAFERLKVMPSPD
ncbi:4-hydroxybutyrate coenzyme A transferase [Echinococcus granulosus]|uniref:Acetyl coenzyme A hydrolase transferase n=2 Tax=Echinococcus granulosus TaxID=6210 RepID=A0A068WZM6_ECHGR|nr:4-hydroxybutyrate coenzyme A transferase [Echinococcus granulosus]CDS23123.1 Acetyl coenzyme A hydrolase transferase [Echinococcus granulosus]